MPASVRPDADRKRLGELLEALGRSVWDPHTLYLVGGTSAIVEGWRASTRDVDVLAVPDSDELLQGIRRLKDELDINVETASPLDFLPPLEGWRDRSPWVAQHGALTVRHLDFRLQALAKVERGFDQDVADVEAMLARGLVSADALREGLAEMEPRLFRFPAVDPVRFAARLEGILRRRRK